MNWKSLRDRLAWPPMKVRLRLIGEAIVWPPVAVLMVAMGFRPLGGRGARRS